MKYNLLACTIASLLAVSTATPAAAAAEKVDPRHDLDVNIFTMDEEDPRPVAADQRVPALTGDAAPLTGYAWWQALLLCAGHYNNVGTGDEANYPNTEKLDAASATSREKSSETLALRRLMADREIDQATASALNEATYPWGARLMILGAMGRHPLGDVADTCRQVLTTYMETHPLRPN